MGKYSSYKQRHSLLLTYNKLTMKKILNPLLVKLLKFLVLELSKKIVIKPLEKDVETEQRSQNNITNPKNFS